MAKQYTYNPFLTVEENAKFNNVPTTTIRTFIHRNNIDRRHDKQLINLQRIQRLYNQGKTITEISALTSLSRPTIYKYLSLDSIQNDNNKQTALTRDNIIKSVSSNQNELLSWIMFLYLKGKNIECDLTYSKGKFYIKIPQPIHKYDKYPQLDDVNNLTELIDKLNLFNSVIFDLPYIVHADNSQLRMVDRFSCFGSIDELYKANNDMVQLSFNILNPKGILIVKTMDINVKGQQHWISNYVLNKANEIGFEHIDTFILIANNKITFNKGQQHCARKWHSYFHIFRKK